MTYLRAIRLVTSLKHLITRIVILQSSYVYCVQTSDGVVQYSCLHERMKKDFGEQGRRRAERRSVEIRLD